MKRTLGTQIREIREKRVFELDLEWWVGTFQLYYEAEGTTLTDRWEYVIWKNTDSEGPKGHARKQCAWSLAHDRPRRSILLWGTLLTKQSWTESGPHKLGSITYSFKEHKDHQSNRKTATHNELTKIHLRTQHSGHRHSKHVKWNMSFVPMN